MLNPNSIILCNDCGCAFREKNIFMKEYRYTGICLCRKCADKLVKEIQEWRDEDER